MNGKNALIGLEGGRIALGKYTTLFLVVVFCFQPLLKGGFFIFYNTVKIGDSKHL